MISKQTCGLSRFSGMGSKLGSTYTSTVQIQVRYEQFLSITWI